MIIVITEVAILVAAKNLVSPKLPIKPVSITPVKGIAKLEKKTGMDNNNIFFFEILDGIVFNHNHFLLFKNSLN